ncbi:MAG: 50S ribosomal protein L35 [Patescibacteria group bacterium]
MKTNKSYTKRLKITKTGKILARKPGFNHYNAKQTRTSQLQGRKPVAFTMNAKQISQFIPHSKAN